MHGFFQRHAYYRRQPQTLAVVQLRRSLHCGVKPTATHCQTVAVMVSYCVTFVVTVYGEFFGEPNSSPHEMRLE